MMKNAGKTRSILIIRDFLTRMIDTKQAKILLHFLSVLDHVLEKIFVFLTRSIRDFKVFTEDNKALPDLKRIVNINNCNWTIFCKSRNTEIIKRSNNYFFFKQFPPTVIYPVVVNIFTENMALEFKTSVPCKMHEYKSFFWSFWALNSFVELQKHDIFWIKLELISSTISWEPEKKM